MAARRTVRREQYDMKWRISMTTRKELTEALRARYRNATSGERTKILNKYMALAGYHRKHAIRVLGDDAPDVRLAPRAQPSLRRSRAAGAQDAVGGR